MVLNPIVNLLVEDAGSIAQSLGFGRALGQIYAYLYFSSEPKSLADMQGALGISKAGASTNIRQLEQWGAVKKIWVKGDRKDFYAASDWFGRIIKSALFDSAEKSTRAFAALLDEMEAEAAQLEDGDGEFIRARIATLRAFQRRGEELLRDPLVTMLDLRP